MSAKQHRAMKQYQLEAVEASRKLTTERQREGSKNVPAMRIPTVVRRVLEITSSVNIDELPCELQQTVSSVAKKHHNTTRATAVQLFNRKDGLHASIHNGLSDIDLYDRVSSVIDELDHSVFDARVSHFSILGTKKDQKGTRYVSAILDEESRMSLQFQANIIKNSVGLEPRDYLIPFHFSFYKTLDQREAEEVLDGCRNLPADYCIALGGPMLKTVVQRTAPPNLR
jgi:hypothetical protein